MRSDLRQVLSPLHTCHPAWDGIQSPWTLDAGKVLGPCGGHFQWAERHHGMSLVPSSITLCCESPKVCQALYRQKDRFNLPIDCSLLPMRHTSCPDSGCPAMEGFLSVCLIPFFCTCVKSTVYPVCGYLFAESQERLSEAHHPGRWQFSLSGSYPLQRSGLMMSFMVMPEGEVIWTHNRYAAVSGSADKHLGSWWMLIGTTAFTVPTEGALSPHLKKEGCMVIIPEHEAFLLNVWHKAHAEEEPCSSATRPLYCFPKHAMEPQQPMLSASEESFLMVPQCCPVLLASAPCPGDLIKWPGLFRLPHTLSRWTSKSKQRLAFQQLDVWKVGRQERLGAACK